MNADKYYCIFCDYSTKRKFDLKRHHNAKHKTENQEINVEEKHIHFEEKHIQNEEKHIHFEEKHIHFEENIYKCMKCFKIYKTKKYLLNHENKCNGIDILTCPKCMKSFSSTCNKSKHIKKNNCKAKSIIHLDNEYIKKEIYINGNNNYNNNNNITNNIIINNYGNERIDYITFDDIIRILKSGNNIIPNYIEYKHFNKDFPENHNIRYERNKGFLIKKNNNWSLINIDHLTDNLFRNNSFELQRYYNNEIKEIENKIKNIELLDFINSRLSYLDLSLDKKIFNKIKDEIKNKIRTLAIYT